MRDFINRLLNILPALRRPKPQEVKASDPVAITMGSEGLAVLKHYEGCKLTAYRDSVGVWTIGYGHTGPEVRAGLVWTQQQAEDALRDRLAREFVPGVLKVIKRSMRQCELDAMVDLAYNIGVGAFHGSTLVRLVNAGDTVGAADEFLRWVNAGGKPLLGLRRRRTADRALFLGATAQEAIKTGSAVT